MVWRLLLTFLFAAQALAWEITVTFTTDLHAVLPRFPDLTPFLKQADLILDGGDAWEDPRILSDEASAWATMQDGKGWVLRHGFGKPRDLPWSLSSWEALERSAFSGIGH